MATPKLAHIVFQTAQPQAMRDFYCTLLEAHVVYSDDNLSFMTYDDEHHRIALLHPIKHPTTLVICLFIGTAHSLTQDVADLRTAAAAQ